MNETTALLAAQPAMAAGFAAMSERLWDDGAVDPWLLELVRIRICQLHGDARGAAERTPQAVAAGFDEHLAAALAAWPTAGGFSVAQRQALEIAELFVIDVHSVSDEQMASLADHLGPAGVVAFSVALGLFDGFTRFRLVRRGGL